MKKDSADRFEIGCLYVADRVCWDYDKFQVSTFSSANITPEEKKKCIEAEKMPIKKNTVFLYIGAAGNFDHVFVVPSGRFCFVAEQSAFALDNKLFHKLEG